MNKQSVPKEYRYCLGFFSSCGDVKFTARFNIKVDECIIGGKLTKSYTGSLVNHARHAREIYRFMLSKTPVVLRCDHFEGEIRLLSSSRFVLVERGNTRHNLWPLDIPQHASGIPPTAHASEDGRL